jgi:hypothetical protein
MVAVLAVHPGALNNFALKLKDGDNLSTIRSRIAKKLNLAAGAENEVIIKYEWVSVLYQLEDGACASRGPMGAAHGERRG